MKFAVIVMILTIVFQPAPGSYKDSNGCIEASAGFL